MAEVRKWISNDEAFREIEPILSARAAGQVPAKDYNVLEQIDRFCALLARVATLSRKPMNEEQLMLWHKSYYSYWLTKAAERQVLKHYVQTHWEDLLELRPPRENQLPTRHNKELTP